MLTPDSVLVMVEEAPGTTELSEKSWTSALLRWAGAADACNASKAASTPPIRAIARTITRDFGTKVNSSMFMGFVRELLTGRELD